MTLKRAPWLLLPCILGVAGYVALVGGDYSVFDVDRARDEVERRQAELDRLREETDSLQMRVDSLENDPSALEAIARQEYGLIREGELLYKIVDPADSLSADTTSQDGADGAQWER